MRVIKECNRESFFQRCIPLGTALGVTAYYGVHAGKYFLNQLEIKLKCSFS